MGWKTTMERYNILLFDIINSLYGNQLPEHQEQDAFDSDSHSSLNDDDDDGHHHYGDGTGGFNEWSGDEVAEKKEKEGSELPIMATNPKLNGTVYITYLSGKVKQLKDEDDFPTEHRP